MLTFHPKTYSLGPEDSPQIRNRAIIHQLRHSEASKVDLTSTLQKNIKIQEVTHEPLNFEVERRSHAILEAGPADGLKTFYDSPYFQTLVSKSKIPRVDFESSPKGIFNLLRDAAQQYKEYWM